MYRPQWANMHRPQWANMHRPQWANMHRPQWANMHRPQWATTRVAPYYTCDTTMCIVVRPLWSPVGCCGLVGCDPCGRPLVVVVSSVVVIAHPVSLDYAALVDAVDLLSLDVLLPLSAGLFVLLALPSLAVFAVSVFPFSPVLVGSSLALAAALALSRWSVL